MEKKIQFILPDIFGDTVRVKILEVLLEVSLKKAPVWLNISQLAKHAQISTSSSKRIVDELIESNLVTLKPIETHAKHPEKEIILNLDDKRIKELLFFYRKLKGFMR